MLYTSEQVLADNLTDNDILKYSRYLNSLVEFEDITSTREKDNLSDSLSNLVDEFLTKNNDSILRLLYNYSYNSKG